jgi:hypothetical protein
MTMMLLDTLSLSVQAYHHMLHLRQWTQRFCCLALARRQHQLDSLSVAKSEAG